MSVFLLDAKRHGNLELDAIIFEVEKSELAKTNAQKQIDLRRIRFILRVSGAGLLMQSISNLHSELASIRLK